MAAFAELSSCWDKVKNWFSSEPSHECKSLKYLFLQNIFSSLETIPCCLRNAVVIIHMSELNAKKGRKAPRDHLDLNHFSLFSAEEIKNIQKKFSKAAPLSVSLPSQLPISNAYLELLFQTFSTISGVQLFDRHFSQRGLFEIISSHSIANIDLSSSKIDDGKLTELVKAHPRITGLDLSSCLQITDQGMEALAGLDNLRTLRAGGLIGVTAEGLKNIPTKQLEYLDLGEPEGYTAAPNVDDSVCKHISTAHQLKYLDLFSAKKGKISDAGIIALASSVSHLFLLNLHNSYIGSSNALMSLNQLRELVYLNLSDDASEKKIEDDVISMLGTLPKLTILKLSGSISSVDGEVFQSLQDSPLELFWFDGNHHKINRGIKHLPKGVVDLKFSPPEGIPLKESELEPLLEFDRLRGLSLFDLPGNFAHKFAKRRPPLEILEIGISDSKILRALIPFGTTLKNLILIYDPEGDPQAEVLRNFRKLEMLTLSTNFSARDYLAFISELRNLRYLSLTDWSTGSGITREVLIEIAKLPLLEMLCIRNSFLQNEDLEVLTQAPSLSHVELYSDPKGPGINDGALVYFRKMRSLTYLDTGGQLSERAIEELRL